MPERTTNTMNLETSNGKKGSVSGAKVPAVSETILLLEDVGRKQLLVSIILLL